MAGRMLDNMIPDDLQGGTEKERAAVRVNLFMAATLHASGVETEVKIRDLSETGAQVEGSLLVDAGIPMTLSRGRLSVQGQVAWRKARRCGLKFSSKISVQDWMANPVNREQQRVDQIVSAVKAGVAPLVPAALHATAPADGLAQDLVRVSRLLGKLGDTLASDPALIAQHGIALQNLDIAVQTLMALAETTQGGGSASVARLVRLNELRARCLEALRNAS
jgi:PilZ domain